MLWFKLTLYIRYGTARMTSLVCAVSPSYFCTFANRVRSFSLSFIPSTTPFSNYLMSVLPKETRSGQLQRQYDNAQYVNVNIHEIFPCSFRWTDYFHVRRQTQGIMFTTWSPVVFKEFWNTYTFSKLSKLPCTLIRAYTKLSPNKNIERTKRLLDNHQTNKYNII